VGINLKAIGGALKELGQTVGNELAESGKALETAAKDVVSGKVSQGFQQGLVALKEAGDAFFDGGAQAIGVAELGGLRYPVKSYQLKLDGKVTRGSRLSDQDISQLKAQGYKSVVNLCLENDDDSARAQALGMNSLHIPILDNAAPTEAQAKQFLDYVTNPQNQPAYFHCEAGQGRTGVMAAVYRMAVQGWPPSEAIAEANQHGFAGHMVPDQAEFLQQFAQDLQAGKIPGYPIQAP
jgi:protein tyrosine phosphatase (PTP) superfamily phosphohydrolase (DUF442 family)